MHAREMHRRQDRRRYRSGLAPPGREFVAVARAGNAPATRSPALPERPGANRARVCCGCSRGKCTGDKIAGVTGRPGATRVRVARHYNGLVGHEAAILGAAAAGAVAGMAWAVRGRASSAFAPSRWRGPAGRKAIALTFDDGPSESTPAILEVLARYRAPATFFQVGANV